MKKIENKAGSNGVSSAFSMPRRTTVVVLKLRAWESARVKVCTGICQSRRQLLAAELGITGEPE